MLPIPAKQTRAKVEKVDMRKVGLREGFLAIFSPHPQQYPSKILNNFS
jgi:hypothetical protein